LRFSIVFRNELEFPPDGPVKVHRFLKNMATAGDFFTGDDLDDLFSLIDGGFLDDNDEFNSAISNMVNEVSTDEGNNTGFKCSQCEKVCKSQRGLTRHVNVKHTVAGTTPITSTPSTSNTTKPTALQSSLNKLHPTQLMCMVSKCAENIYQDMCFPLSLRLKFSTEHFSFTQDDAESLWYVIRPVVDSCNGDAEKFYSKFYALFLDNILPRKFDDKTVTNTLLAEVANEVLAYLSGNNVMGPEGDVSVGVSEKELKSLQYLAGYVIHKLYTKFRFSKNSASVFNHHCCLILHACKVETDVSQTLIDARDRGGLWKISKRMQSVFLECEKLFRKSTSGFISKLSCEVLVQEAFKNSIVISCFNALVLSVDVYIKKEFRMNLLEHILTLYFRVRSFSYAKDIREKHKAAKKESRMRSLRTEINRASSSTDEKH